MKTATRRRSFWIGVLVEVLALFVVGAFADKGFLNFSIWNRSLFSRNQSYGLPNSSETIFHLDFSQDITNYGTITALVDGLFSKGNNRFSRSLVTWTGLKAGVLTFDLKGGDDYLVNTNLDSRFINLYHPYIYFRGGSAGFTSKTFDLTAYGGKIARLTGLLGSTYDILNQPFYGLRARTKFGKAFILGGGIFLTENQTDAAGVLAARKSDVILVDSEIAVVPGVQILGEFRRSRSEDPALKTTSGNSFRFGPLVNAGRWSFEANYRAAGSHFRDLTPESQISRDEKGIFSSARFQASRSLSLFGIMDRSTDNVERDPSRNVNNALSLTSGFNLYSPSFLDVTAQWEFEQRKSEKILPYSIDVLSNGVLIQASKTVGRFFPYLRYRWQKSQDEMNPGMTGSRPTLFLGLRHSLSGGSYLWLEGEWTRKIDASHSEVERNINLRSGLNYTFSSKFNVYAELFYHRLGVQNALKQIEAFLGLRISVFKETTLNIDFRMLEPLQGNNQPSNYTFTLRFDRRFSWGAPPRILGRYGIGQGPIGVGTIEGTIFEDRNGNGAMEPGEKGLAAIPLKLEDGSTVVTNSEGRYRFSNVAEGPHQIRIEERNIPATLYILSPTQVNVLVEPRVTRPVHFLMISSSALSGRLMEDTNLSGKIDTGDKGLADVLVFLAPAEKSAAGGEPKQLQAMILNTYTNTAGAYLFDNIPPGEYKLSIDTETLPTGAKVSVELPLLIKLEPGGKLEGQDVMVLPRPVIRRQEKSPTQPLEGTGFRSPRSSAALEERRPHGLDQDCEKTC